MSVIAGLRLRFNNLLDSNNGKVVDADNLIGNQGLSWIKIVIGAGSTLSLGRRFSGTDLAREPKGARVFVCNCSSTLA